MNRRAVETRNADLQRCAAWRSRGPRDCPAPRPDRTPLLRYRALLLARRLHGDHRNAANAAATMDRGEQLFRAREARERAAEAALLAEYDREVAEKEARDRAAAQAEALAKELERRQREHDAKQRMQQKVRRGSCAAARCVSGRAHSHPTHPAGAGREPGAARAEGEAARR